jgi:hypothetical protein
MNSIPSPTQNFTCLTPAAHPIFDEINTWFAPRVKNGHTGQTVQVRVSTKKAFHIYETPQYTYISIQLLYITGCYILCCVSFLVRIHTQGGAAPMGQCSHLNSETWLR